MRIDRYRPNAFDTEVSIRNVEVPQVAEKRHDETGPGRVHMHVDAVFYSYFCQLGDWIHRPISGIAETTDDCHGVVVYSAGHFFGDSTIRLFIARDPPCLHCQELATLEQRRVSCGRHDHVGVLLHCSIYIEDIAATIYSALGIDWGKKISNTPSGRAFEYLKSASGTTFLDVSEVEPLFT